MPLLTVKTNVEVLKANELIEFLTDAIASATGKPKTYVSVILDDKKTMAIGGTLEPCAMIYLGADV